MTTQRRRRRTVLVAARRQRTRCRVAGELEAAGFRVVATSGSAAEAVAEARRLRPEVCVVEHDLAGGGTTAARALASLHRPPSVLMLADGHRPPDLFAALRAGAAGWLVKELDPVGLAEATRAVAEGRTVLPPELVGPLVAEFRKLSVAAPTTQEGETDAPA